MGGKRFRWIYFQIGQLSLLALAAFVAAIAVAVPAGSGRALQLSILTAADISVMVWIPSLVLWMLVTHGRKQRPLRLERELRVSRLASGKPPERKAAIRTRISKRLERLALREYRGDRYELFPTLFIVSASIILTGFYGLLRDPVALKGKYPGFYVNAELVLPIMVLALAFGTAIGSTLRSRTAFLMLFAIIGISSFHMILTRTWYAGPSAAWRDIGMIACRFTGIGALATGIAAGIFLRELIRYRRRERQRQKT